MENNKAIINCSIRISRNIAKMPFVHKQSDEARSETVQRVASALPEGEFELIIVNDKNKLRIRSLIEHGLCSSNMTMLKGGAVLLAKNERVCISVNDVDHIRILARCGGSGIAEAYAEVTEIDSLLEKKLTFSFDPQLGYLSPNPSCIGTGMTASFVLHLAGISIAKQTDAFLLNAAKLGCLVRPVYSDSNGPIGQFYSLSNQHTLGMTENEIIGRMSDIAAKVSEQEMQLRSAAYESKTDAITDLAMRSLGVCKYAYKLSMKEMLQHISNILLGESLGILTIDNELAKRIITECSPCTIALCAENIDSADAENKHRAEKLKSLMQAI